MREAAPILLFLEGTGRDGAGRTFEDVLGFDDAAIDARHDFIQWLFPLDEPSRAVPNSPVLDRAVVADLRDSQPAQKGLQRAAEWMLAFYARSPVWLRSHDHNHLRITRIIKSLRLLVGDEAADAFKQRIMILAQGAPIPSATKAYWDAA